MDNNDKKLVTFEAPALTRKQLAELAEHTGRTKSGWLRFIIRREWLDLTLDKEADTYKGEGVA